MALSLSFPLEDKEGRTSACGAPALAYGIVNGFLSSIQLVMFQLNEIPMRKEAPTTILLLILSWYIFISNWTKNPPSSQAYRRTTLSVAAALQVYHPSTQSTLYLTHSKNRQP